MPIQIGDRIFRNIQEQVGKNQADISALKLAQALGLKNIGTLDAASDIPEGTYHYGEYYFIGTEAPYEVYIYTNHDGVDEFINLGTLEGPQGDIGLPGSAGTIEIVNTITGEPGSNASVVNTGTPSAAKLTITIPTGAAGPQGPVGSRGQIGPVGPEGPEGPQGIPGDPGQSFMIVGTITSEAQLPDPGDTPRNYAYVYNDEDPTTPNRLYYIIGTEGNEEWSYSSFAVAGTTVTVNGSPVYSWDADNKLNVNNPVATGSFSMGRKTGSIVGASSVAIGGDAEATRTFNIAVGWYAKATGLGSVAIGDNIEAKHSYSQVFGVNCSPDPSSNSYNQLGNYARIIGNGTSTAPEDLSNAEALDWSGNLHLKGDLYIGCNNDSTGGTHIAPLYEHNIVQFNNSSPQTCMITLNFISTVKTGFSSISDLVTYIRTWGAGTQRIFASGTFYYNSKVYVCSYFVVTSSYYGWVATDVSTGISETIQGTQLTGLSQSDNQRLLYA